MSKSSLVQEGFVSKQLAQNRTDLDSKDVSHRVSYTPLFFSEFHSGQDKAHYLTLKFPDGLTFLTPRPRSTKQESDKNLSVQKTRLTYLSL